MGSLADVYDRLRDGHPDAYVGALREVSAAEIIAAIETGTVLNASGIYGQHEEIPLDEDISGRYVDIEANPPVPTARLASSTLRTVLLAYSGKSRDEMKFDPRGLRIERVIVAGSLDWSWFEVPFPTGFWGCIFFDFSMDVNHAKVRRLVFDGCFFGPPRFGGSTFYAAETTCESAIRFLSCEGLSQLFLVDCDLATFEIRDHPGGAEAEAFTLVLAGSTVRTFIIQGDNLPREAIPAKDGLHGIVIERVNMWRWENEGSSWKAEWLGQWLAGGPLPHPVLRRAKRRAGLNPHQRQVWSEFAAAFERDSLDEESTAIRIAAERHRDACRPWPVRVFRWLTLDLTVRYFHRNIRALWLLALIWIAVAVVSWSNIHVLYGEGPGGAPDGPLDSGSDGIFWALAYSADIVVSPLQLGFDQLWPSAPRLMLVFAVLKLLAITMFGLFVVGVSGVVQRSRGART